MYKRQVFGGFFGLSAADGIALWLLPGGHATTVLSVAVLVQLPRDCFTGDRNRLVLARELSSLALHLTALLTQDSLSFSLTPLSPDLITFGAC